MACDTTQYGLILFLPEIRKRIVKYLTWRDIQNLLSSCSVLHGEIKDDGTIPDDYSPQLSSWRVNYKFVVDFETVSSFIEREPRKHQLIKCMSGYYVTDVKWLGNYELIEQQSYHWNMDLGLTPKPQINQIAVIFCLGRNVGAVDKYLPMVCSPMRPEFDYEFCEMQFQNERKKDLLDFFNLVPIREAHFLKNDYRKYSQPFGFYTTEHYPSKIDNYLLSIVDDCAIICNDHLVDWEPDEIVKSFTAWYTDIPAIAFQPVESKDAKSDGSKNRCRRNRSLVQKAINERQCNWKIIPDPRRLMYLPMTNRLPRPMSSGIRRPGKHLRNCVVPGLEMRVFKSSRAIADSIYDDQYVHCFGNRYRPIVATAVFKGESRRAKANALNRQMKILDGKNRAEQKKLDLEYIDDIYARMWTIYEAHGVLDVNEGEARKNMPEICVPNVQTTTLLLRYSSDKHSKTGDPSLLVLPCRFSKGIEDKPESLKYGRLLRNINRAVHSWPEKWWRRLYEFLNSKTFLHSTHNPPYTCNALLVTDIKRISTAANGIKKKIRKLFGDSVRVYEPLEGHCHMLLDGTVLSLIVTESPPAMSNGLHNLVNIIHQIQQNFPSFVNQHRLPEYHGIVKIAIRIEIPSLSAFGKENNGEKLTDLLIEWGKFENPVIDLLCNANTGPQRKKKKEEGAKKRKALFAEREKKKRERRERGTDSEEDEYLSAEEEHFEEVVEAPVGGAEDKPMEGAVGGAMDGADSEEIDWQTDRIGAMLWEEEQEYWRNIYPPPEEQRRKRELNRRKHEKYKLSGKKKDPWSNANGRIRFTLRAKSKEQIEKLINEVEQIFI